MVTVTVTGAAHAVVVEVGAGLQCPFAAVPNPHQWETGLLIVVALVVVDVLVLVVTADELVLVVMADELVLVEVDVEKVVLVAVSHFPCKSVPRPHQ